MFTKIKEFAFKGLIPSYYFRNIFFGSFFCAGLIYLGSLARETNPDLFYGFLVLWPISLLLFPYSRFVIDTIYSFIMGDHVFFVNLNLWFIVKFITMFLCFYFAVFIAPIGLIILYIINSRAYKKYQEEMTMLDEDENNQN